MHTDLPADAPHERPAEHDGTQPSSRLRRAAWVAAAVLFLLPMIAMPFSDAVAWTLGDFLIAGLLLFGSLGLYELAARAPNSSRYRAGIGLALGAAVLLLWTNGAVGITDSQVDVLYLGVIAVGIAGACLARFRARGMAVAMGVTAAAQALVGVGALVSGVVPAFNSAAEILGITGLFVVLFAGSAWMFWEAARREDTASR